jgi:Uma2 family endonuclease
VARKNRAGEFVIQPPVGGESAYRDTVVTSQLGNWSEQTGHGKAFGPTFQVMLPDGSSLCPDAAWVSNERLAGLNREQLRRFPPLVPEFIVEVMSPSDRLHAAQRMMQDWIDNGVELGWLIDGDNRCVFVYRRGQEMRQVLNESQIEGVGPIEGFVLDLTDIWAGL